MTVRYQPELIAAPLTPRMAEAIQIDFEYLFADLKTLDTTVSATLVSLGTALTPVAGGVCYSTSAALALSAAGTSRQLLQSGGTGAPTWTSDLLTSTTIGTAYIYRVGGTDVAVADGGTGLSSYAVGDILHATATGTIAGLADVAVGQVLASGGIGVVAAWSANVSVTGSVTAGTGFGCNSKSAQTAYASGGALNAYGTGAFGLDSDANMSALHALVVSMRAALVANGILS